jgi:hypothetical protein
MERIRIVSDYAFHGKDAFDEKLARHSEWPLSRTTLQGG